MHDIERLLKLREASKRQFIGNAATVVALERDALGIALDIFDSSKNLRNKILSTWAPSSYTLPPFLQDVDAIRLTEEQMIANDSKFFPNAKISPNLIGTQFEIGERKLDVIYANRTPLEKTFGVELIYYNHVFKAYTLVQYKRMTTGNASS